MCRTLCTCGKDPTRPAPPQLMCQESWGLWPRPGQLASRSRALLREAWVLLLGVLVQGTAEETAGRGAPRPGGGTQIQQLLFSGQGAWLPPTPTWGGHSERSSRAPRAQNPHCPLKSRPRRGLGRSPGRKGTPGHPGSRVLPLGSISVDPSPHAAGPARGEGEPSCGETMLASYQRGSQVPTVGRRGEPGQLLPTPRRPAPACACSAL